MNTKTKAMLAAMGATVFAAATTSLAFGQDFSPVGGTGGKGATGGASQGKSQGLYQGLSQGHIFKGATVGNATGSNIFSRGGATANTSTHAKNRAGNSNKGANGGKGGGGGNAGNHF